MSQMKSCSVLLNRNLTHLKEYNEASKNSEGNTSRSGVSEKPESMLREREKIKYFDEENIDSDGSLQSETSDDSSFSGESSESEKSSGEKKKNKDKARKINPKKLTCYRCEKSFSTHSSYVLHKRSHQSKHFKCTLCREAFLNRQSFINHMKRNHPEMEPFLCQYPGCEKSFKLQSLLKIHHKKHWKYMCRFCKKLFIRKRDMLMHVSEIH